MKLKRKLIISAATALMLSTAVVNSETLQGKEGVVKGSYVYAATTGLMTEDGFKYNINDDNTITITKYTGNAESLTIPSTIENYDVSEIEKNAFKKCQTIINVNIPESVKTIGDYTFAECNKLESITIAGATTIGHHAFEKCTSLTNVSLPDTLESIAMYAFSGCTSLNSINLPNSLNELPRNLFLNCESLEKMVLPDSIESVSIGLFSGCSSISDVTLPSNLKLISQYAFSGCASLESIILPDALETIEPSAFQNCKSLSTIELPSNITAIANYAFSGCEKLEKIMIPEGVRTIGNSAFFNCKSLCEIELPSNIMTIADYTFSGCEKLININVPESVTTIGKYAFASTGFKSFTIPEYINVVGSGAFVDCVNLENINVNTESEAEWGGNIFDGCISLQKLNGEEIIGFDEDGFPTINSKIKDFVTNNMEDESKSLAGIGFWNTYTQLYVKKVVECETTPEMTDVEKAKALHDWICTKVEYDSDNKKANKNHVDYSVFFYDSTVCEGYARAYALLLQEAGFKEDEVYVVANNVHAWNIVKLGKEYFHIDVCHDDEIEDSYNYSHFMLSDNQIKNNCSSGHSIWSVDKLSNLFNYDGNITTPTCDHDIMGDLNLDFKIDKSDLEIMEQIIIGNNFKATTLQTTIADLTFDGRVDVYDLILLRERFFEITKQPTNAVAPKNEFAEVTVEAKGVDLTYKWYYKNKGDSEFTHTEKYDGLKKYSVQMNEARDGRQIYCEITNKYGMVLQTEIVTLYMGNPMEIVKQPETIVAPLGTEGKTNIIVSGDGDLKYEWYFKNKSDTEFTHTKTYDGWKTYSVEMNEARDGRQIYCKITDKYGISIQTDIVTLHMGNPLEITKQPVNVSAEYGNEAKTNVVAKGDGLTYKWYYKNKGDSKFYYTSTYDNMKTYSVDMNEARDGRQIYCEITDKYGVTVQTEIATLNLLK